MKRTTVAIAAALALSSTAAIAVDINCRPFSAAVDRTTFPASYTVKQGDNLHLISCMFYDNARHWKRIWAANRQAIANANVLEPGTVLTIPKP
jgi:nucleoid-associated protein YgaU